MDERVEVGPVPAAQNNTKQVSLQVLVKVGLFTRGSVQC